MCGGRRPATKLERKSRSSEKGNEGELIGKGENQGKWKKKKKKKKKQHQQQQRKATTKRLSPRRMIQPTKKTKSRAPQQ